ncbi:MULTISPECIES: ROK family transcriptional regulator [unclassified Phaeobacter]|uniref:ROK family transcriptional regulator n=1 Tax=unclassified Phaeobacter TaxID=2621772 RepID=UPI003A8A1301
MDNLIPAFPLSLGASERQVMQIVKRHQPIARSRITELTSLSQQSVHRLVEGLTAQRLLTSEKAIVTGRGKPSPQIVLDNTSAASLGVSIRTDKVDMRAMTLSGQEIACTVLSSAPSDRDAVLREVRETLIRWFDDGPLADRKAIGIGVAMQGYRTTHRNRYTAPLPIDSWSRLDIEKLFSTELELPTYSENNANCAALAEQHCGGGREFESFAYLSFNFGFGGGIVLNQKLVAGGFGNAGELSDLFLPEEVPHRPALGELLKRLAADGISIADVSELQRNFDPEWAGVVEWLTDISPYLNLTVRALRAIADPEAIFFGGEAPVALRNCMIAKCDRPSANRYGEITPFPKLLLSNLSGDVAALGAAILPLSTLVF